ncbi:hypothetical protein INS49_004306 [Diaporthe citri]|uniref:uncharacterized protein n=1 Tax=Diaporthe citri TaxID=83186 RepID=UPI001C7E7FC6|nr:uncharacterized protein INS49_004306 [Diaporthe citri]KAG6355225.1 hypothetical protein INS49_004306 [Diaporthe citri]
MCAALQFDDIVKVGLMFDPSGYGTIVWGVLSGVLKLVQNDKNRADAVFESAAVLAKFLPKYAIIEDHYRDRQTQEQKAFEDQIRNVYASILKYSACVQKQLDLSIAGRLSESFCTVDNRDIKILKDELTANDETVTEKAHLVAHQYRKQEFQKLETQAVEALNKVDLSIQRILQAEKLRTLKWLSDSPLTDKQQQLRSKVEKLNKNSGKWLLASREYTSWLKLPHSFLWLYGTSGCGKSILCSTVVKQLAGSVAKNDNMIVAYWYFDNADPQTQDLQRLVRLVLRRTSAKATPFPEPVRDLANKHEAAGSAPGITALMKALQATIAALEEELFLVLDAIDEYQTGKETFREEFLDFLVELGNAKLPKLHILVTSVSEIGIKTAFARIRPTPANMDIEKRFRIVSLQLEDLRKCYDDSQIDAVLSRIPGSIEDAYLRKLQGVPSKDARRLRHIFCWISVAARQLTTSELAAAPGVELPNPEDLSNICPSSMIRLEQQRPPDEDQIDLPQEAVHSSSRTETNVVTFDHPSVKRFLYSRKLQDSAENQVSQFFVSEKDVHAEFTRLMVDHLLAIEQPSIRSSIAVSTPFIPYAARYWHEHLRSSGSSLEEDKVLSSKLLTLFRDPMSPAYLNWIRTWDPERKTTDSGLTTDSCPSPLYMAIFLRLESISRILIDEGSYINGTGGLMCTSLQLASQREDIEISQKLVASGEDIDRISRDQPTALFIAVDHSNAKLVQMLLEAGAKPDAGSPQNRSALQLASLRGSKSIVELLVASGADVNLRSGSFGTALQAAAAAGHTDIVGILLDKRAKLDTVGGLLGTAIQAAQTGGHSGVVTQLADRGAAWDEEGDSRKGQLGTESKHYVYRALFWALLLRGQDEAQGLMKLYDAHDEVAIHLDLEMDKFSFTILPLASSQMAIERSTSDELRIARHELVKCYALAFEVVSRVLQQLQSSKGMTTPLAARTIKWDSLNEFQRQYEKLESLMRIARLQELSSCNKCAKKGLDCPGYGIRYRFADGKTASSTEFEPAESSRNASPPSPASSFSAKRRQPDLKWVDVSSRVKRARATGKRRPSADATTGAATPLSSTVRSSGEALDIARRQQGIHAFGPSQQYIDSGGHDHHYWTRQIRGTSPQETFESSSAHGSEDDVIEIMRTGDLDCTLARPEFSPIPKTLPSLLSNPDPRIRLLFKHFSTHVSPVMLMYDDEANGYRRQILPLAHADPIVERAVCVAAAFHLSRQVPELRLPAESGRAAIVSKLSSEVDLSDSTWATLILLIVADLVTGHEHVLALYKMLVAFLDARGHPGEAASPLQNFLYNQSKLISLFAYPILGKSKAVADFSKFLTGLMASHEQLKQRQRQSVEFLVSSAPLPTSTQWLFDSRTRLYMEITRAATEIYVLRACTPDDSSPGTALAPATASRSETTVLPLLPNLDATETAMDETYSPLESMPDRIALIRGLFEQVDPSAPGSHTIVWPAFIAAAESREDDNREFFSSVLRRLWQSTGYDNVLRGLDALPALWERQRSGQRWTAALQELKTVVM